MVAQTCGTIQAIVVVTFASYESARRILNDCRWLAGIGVLRSSVTSLRSTICAGVRPARESLTSISWAEETARRVTADSQIKLSSRVMVYSVLYLSFATQGDGCESNLHARRRRPMLV